MAAMALALLALIALPTQAQAADAPIGLGTTASYGVLAGSAVTNTGPSVIGGDVGVSPSAAISGFPPGLTTTEVGPTTTEAGTATSEAGTGTTATTAGTATTDGATSTTTGTFTGGGAGDDAPPAITTSTLPRTGLDLARPVLVAALAIGLGLAFVCESRRRVRYGNTTR